MKRSKLRLFNDFLTVVIVILCLYVIVTPFLPKATLVVKKDPPLVAQKPAPDQKISIPNTLVIPKIKLQEPIYDSASPLALNKGVWHPSATSTPDKGGNTVLTGHRFTYLGPAVFYNLPEVDKGDPITLYWNNQPYEYIVTGIQVTSPKDTSVIKSTPETKLTIYTCTPLITAKNRLIIIAEPVKSEVNR